MSKNIKKTQKTYNTTVLNALAAKYTFTTRYIRAILDGDRTPAFSDKIKEEYKAQVKAMQEIINTNKNII